MLTKRDKCSLKPVMSYFLEGWAWVGGIHPFQLSEKIYVNSQTVKISSQLNSRYIRNDVG